MVEKGKTYKITQMDGETPTFSFVAMSPVEVDEYVPTATGLVGTKRIGYWVNALTSPVRQILVGEVRKKGNVLQIEDLNPVFNGKPSVFWQWEPLTLVNWKTMDVEGRAELERDIRTDDDLVNFYLHQFTPDMDESVSMPVYNT